MMDGVGLNPIYLTNFPTVIRTQKIFSHPVFRTNGLGMALTLLCRKTIFLYLPSNRQRLSSFRIQLKKCTKPKHPPNHSSNSISTTIGVGPLKIRLQKNLKLNPSQSK